MTTFLPGCSEPSKRRFELTAIVPFENLSGNKDSVLGVGVAVLTTGMTTGNQAVRVVTAASTAEARQIGATRIVTGWYDVTGSVGRFHGTVRDTSAQNTISSFLITGSVADYEGIARSVALKTGAPLHDYPAVKPEALEPYLRALVASEPGEKLQFLQQSLRADATFGAAHVARVAALLRTGDRDSAMKEASVAGTSRLSGADRVRLELMTAEVQGDPGKQASLLRKLSELDTGDVSVLRNLMEAQTGVRDFRGAADTATRILEFLPTDEEALNRRGYMWAYAGDLARAREAFKDYTARMPQSANAQDSLGEVLFYFRQYDEAAAHFLRANQLNPSALGGAELFRSALALHFAGKTAEADALLKPVLDRLQQSGDPNRLLFRDLWRFVTNRHPDWPATRPGLIMQSLSALVRGDRSAAAEVAQQARKLPTPPAEAGMVAILDFLTRPGTSKQGWQERVENMTSDPRQSALRTQLLGWALLLDAKAGEAADTLWPLLEQTPVLDPLFNDLRMTVTWALVRAGRIDDARRVMPYGFMPPAGLQPGLQVLLYSALQDARKRF